MMTTMTTRRGRRRGEEGSEVVVRGLNGRIRRARPTCARRRRRRRRGEAGTRARGGPSEATTIGARGRGRERWVRVARAIVVDVETTAS